MNNFIELLSWASPSLFLPTVFQFIGPPLLGFLAESGVSVNHILSCISWIVPKSKPRSRKKEREKTTKFHPTLLGLYSSNQRGRFSFLSFRCLKAPLLPPALQPRMPWDIWGLGHERTEKTIFGISSSVWSLETLFYSRDITRGLLEFCLFVPLCPLPGFGLP